MRPRISSRPSDDLTSSAVNVPTIVRPACTSTSSSVNSDALGAADAPLVAPLAS
jgi:hypothetical protein